MQWLVKNSEEKRIAIPESIIESLIVVIDSPRGSIQIDPYEDYLLYSSRLPEVINNINKGIQSLRQMHRQETIRKLNLIKWEEWALATQEALEKKDILLDTLLNLKNLCSFALKENLNVFVVGD